VRRRGTRPLLRLALSSIARLPHGASVGTAPEVCDEGPAKAVAASADAGALAKAARGVGGSLRPEISRDPATASDTGKGANWARAIPTVGHVVEQSR